MLVITLNTTIAAGAPSIEIPAEALAGLSLGDCFLLEGGGNSEVVCIAGFGSSRVMATTILLVSPTQFGYPAGSTLTLLQGGPGSTSTTSADQASVRDDPHVCSLSGECYDIRMPSEYTLLLLPHSGPEPVKLKVSAGLETDGERPCGLFVKHLALSGSWLDDQVVRIRPYTRNVGGSNWVGDKAMTNFSLQLGNSLWRSFTHKESLRLVSVVGQLTIRFVWREQYGQRMEAQSFEFSVGEGSHPAVLTVSQASHQALNLDMRDMGRLGYSRIGGVLGTEGHAASIEEPTSECRAASSPSDPDVTKRQTTKQGPPDHASTLKVSWE
jgi:hypothetical protein